MMLAAQIGTAQSLAELQKAFRNPPPDARIMVRWWWFGPCATKAELEREMRFMKEGGIGGFEVQPVYPQALDGNYPYLSDEFIDALRFTALKARELGLRMDLTLGSGWPYGGPNVPITEAAGKLRHSTSAPTIAEGEKLIAEFPGSFFISSRTRQKVKRAAVGAEGYVLDHYDRAALDHYLKTTGARLMEAFRGGAPVPHAIFCDSLEVFGSDWTGDFLEQFQKRRGYDLKPHLPELLGEPNDQNGAVRVDWGRTLTELAEENFLTPLREWAHKHGTLLRCQAYGCPPVALSSNALVDLPEGEGAQWNSFSSTRWATSAGHLYGRPVISSETWTWLHSPAFRATPLDIKAEADRHFLQGVNQLVGHGFPYSPESAGKPGWAFYAAAALNQNNPWWIVMPDVTLYLQRISSLLRQGKPVNDVAIYVPTDDARAGFTLGRISVNRAAEDMEISQVIPRVLAQGYNFDLIDDGAIEKVGIPYPVLVLPAAKRIPEATRRKIEAYRSKGGIVVDSDVSGLSKLYPPDIVMSPAAPDIGFVHRRTASADIFFIANTSNRRQRTQMAFSHVKRTHSELWDPFTCERGLMNLVWDLEPYGSRVLVFSNEPAAASRLDALYPKVADISTGWKVTIGERTVTMDKLTSWTDNPATRFFSGTALYEKTVKIPPLGRVHLDFGEGTALLESGRKGPGMQALLDGPVREAAVVYVNAKRAGSVWHPPYSVEITKLVHPGENTIRIVVANTAINEWAGRPPTDYTALNAKYGERATPQDVTNLKPVPSGILGTIRLVQ